MDEHIQRAAARVIVDSGAVSFGHYKLSSGMESRIYVDMRLIPGKPRLFRKLLGLAVSLIYIAGLEERADTIVGVATGGIPWATGLALELGMPLAYVRPEAKRHGRGRVVEGNVEGLRALVVDDVATTGGSLERAIRVLREAGSKPTAIVVLLDRLQGAKRRLESEALLFYSLTTITHILDEARRAGLASEEDIEAVKSEIVEEV